MCIKIFCAEEAYDYRDFLRQELFKSGHEPRIIVSDFLSAVKSLNHFELMGIQLAVVGEVKVDNNENGTGIVELIKKRFPEVVVVDWTGGKNSVCDAAAPRIMDRDSFQKLLEIIEELEP